MKKSIGKLICAPNQNYNYCKNHLTIYTGSHFL